MYGDLLDDLTSDDLNQRYLNDRVSSPGLKLNRTRKRHANEGYEKNGRYEILSNFDSDSY
jgi:hypothetical protein